MGLAEGFKKQLWIIWLKIWKCKLTGIAVSNSIFGQCYPFGWFY